MLVNGGTLEELARRAGDACASGTVHGLLLHGVFPLTEIDSNFIRTYLGAAQKWQAAERPPDLFINHGEFIHKHGDGVGYIHDELRRKPDSNRACLCLINMKEFLESHDDPIPSFLVLQFGFPGGQFRRIVVGAYFRALEVRSFLPINLAEICERLRELKRDFPHMDTFELHVLAFRAYSREAFHCLARAELDIAGPVAIAIAVDRGDKPQLMKWLNSKLIVEESVVCTDGLTHLYDALTRCKDKYAPELLESTRLALECLKQLKEARTRTSESSAIAHIEKRVHDYLENAKKRLK
jgi:hypothetical protein